MVARLEFIPLDPSFPPGVPWRHPVINDPDERLSVADLGPWPFVWSPHRRHLRKLYAARAARNREWLSDRLARVTFDVCEIELKTWGIGLPGGASSTVRLGQCKHGMVPFIGSEGLARLVMAQVSP